jgi:hypothetical protein
VSLTVVATKTSGHLHGFVWEMGLLPLLTLCILTRFDSHCCFLSMTIQRWVCTAFNRPNGKDDGQGRAQLLCVRLRAGRSSHTSALLWNQKILDLTRKAC